MAEDAGITSKLPPVFKRIAEQTPESPVPICVLVVGMAGSGKTTLMSQLQNSTMSYDDDDDDDDNEEEEKGAEEDIDKKTISISIK